MRPYVSMVREPTVQMFRGGSIWVNGGLGSRLSLKDFSTAKSEHTMTK